MKHCKNNLTDFPKKSQQFTISATKERIYRIITGTMQSIIYFTSIYTQKI